MRLRRGVLRIGFVVACIGAVLIVALTGHILGADRLASSRLTIIVDAGHGGRDPGVVVDGVEEADLNLIVARRVVELLRCDSPVDAAMTRTIDVHVSHADRIGLAEELDAALYVSIQANACDSSDVGGIETCVDDKHLPGDPSWQLAEIIQASLVAATGGRDRGVRSMELYLRRTDRPAVLVEVGFLTCPAEREKLLSEEYQERVAHGIATGILQYLEYAALL